MAENKENASAKKSFFSNMIAELKKVIWPTGQQTAKSTATTIAFVLLITVILVVLNLGFEELSKLWWTVITK